MSKVLKAGYLAPPLIVNFVWEEDGAEKQEIRFYPFIRKTELRPYTAKITRENRQYKMFDYVLKKAEYYVLYKK